MCLVPDEQLVQCQQTLTVRRARFDHGALLHLLARHAAQHVRDRRGLVPHQHSSGGKPRLLGISKRGDPGLRSLLIHGARALLAHAARRNDRLGRWALALSQRRPFNVAAVALANKLARIAWVLLARGERFDPARA